MNDVNIEDLYSYVKNADLATTVYPNLTERGRKIVDLLRSIRQVFVDHNLTEKQFDLITTETLLMKMGYTEHQAVNISACLHGYIAEDSFLNFTALEKIEIKVIANDAMKQARTQKYL